MKLDLGSSAVVGVYCEPNKIWTLNGNFNVLAYSILHLNIMDPLLSLRDTQDLRSALLEELGIVWRMPG